MYNQPTPIGYFKVFAVIFAIFKVSKKNMKSNSREKLSTNINPFQIRLGYGV
jgi:hypothetical protein